MNFIKELLGLKKYKIVIPPIVDWAWMTQRPQGLAKAFAELGHTVYYCQNLNQNKGKKPEEILPNLFLCADIELIEDKVDIFWNSSPYMYHMVCKWHERLSVYDCVDDFYKLYGKMEDRLTRDSDIIFATCNILYDRKVQQKGKDKVFILPNAYDESLREYRDYEWLTVPADIGHFGDKKIIGYIGALADWLDYNMIKLLAQIFTWCEIVLIGCEFHPMPDWLKNKEVKNVHWLGLKPHEELPSYISAIDVCILPFLSNDTTNATDPIKLYEYLSFGKPVVAYKLDTIEKFKDVVFLAENHLQFIDYVQKALIFNSYKEEEKRIQYIDKFTWKYRAEEALRVINKKIIFRKHK
jgi:glycosyltransferase involved in cell wall biosynthesis